MKRYYFLSMFTMIVGLLGIASMDAAAQHRGGRIIQSGNAKVTGGNGGSANGKSAQGGNGGAANAKAGSIATDKKGSTIQNAGNATATGGNGGAANGDGAKGGNGGAATAKGGDIGIPINGLPAFPTKGNPKAGGGSANAGGATATGGNGGNANGTGAKGGNGGGAVAVSGNGNTVVNGNNNTVIGKVVNNNISFSIGGGGFGGGSSGGGFADSSAGFVTDGPAFAQGGFAGDGAIQGAPGLALASSPSETVLTNDATPAIAQGADGKDYVQDGEVEQVFTRRLLKVKNDSGVPMKVFVQYRGQDDKKWSWMPASPSESKDALVYDLTPGQEMYLDHKGAKVSASRVRIWGVAEGQTWFDYRDQDLWVVPEMDQHGEHRYQATDMRTFTFVFPKQENVAAK